MPSTGLPNPSRVPYLSACAVEPLSRGQRASNRVAGASGADGLMWLTSEWHARTGAIVALSFHPTEFGYPVKDLEPRLVLLQELSAELEPVARGLVDLSGANCITTPENPRAGGIRRRTSRWISHRSRSPPGKPPSACG